MYYCSKVAASLVELERQEALVVLDQRGALGGQTAGQVTVGGGRGR